MFYKVEKFTKAIIKKLINQCRNLKYLHQVKLKNNSLHQKHEIAHIVE